MQETDNDHRSWMRKQLDHAAEHFGLTVIGDPIFGWNDRTIGCRTSDGRWLRVSWSKTQWINGEWWTGNEEAVSIAGVPKPTVLEIYDWSVSGDDWECRNRAEVMTLIEDQACSSTPELRAELDLPDEWWVSLRKALDALAKYPTKRGTNTQEDVTNRPDTARRVHETFADVLDSHDGKIAQLYAVSRYLRRVQVGDFHNLVDQLHEHARRIIADHR